MSNRTGAGHALDDLSQLSTAQRRLTAVIFLAPLLVWTCSLPAGARFSPWALFGVVLLTVFTVIHPDSLSGPSAHPPCRSDIPLDTRSGAVPAGLPHGNRGTSHRARAGRPRSGVLATMA
jgi:hypothetical protein